MLQTSSPQSDSEGLGSTCDPNTQVEDHWFSWGGAVWGHLIPWAHLNLILVSKQTLVSFCSLFHFITLAIKRKNSTVRHHLLWKIWQRSKKQESSIIPSSQVVIIKFRCILVHLLLHVEHDYRYRCPCMFSSTYTFVLFFLIDIIQISFIFPLFKENMAVFFRSLRAF